MAARELFVASLKKFHVVILKTRTKGTIFLKRKKEAVTGGHVNWPTAIGQLE